MAAKKTQADSDNPTHKEVWDTLTSINVNEHTESKMNLTYLSWAWAWKILKDNYPNAKYGFTSHSYTDGLLDYMQYPDGSGAVSCTIYIGKHVKESMWLPVMDNRNNAIKEPNARQVSDAKMRCLVKCISMLGLGLYIYAGEDLPDESDPAPSEKKSSKINVKGSEPEQSLESNTSVLDSEQIAKVIEEDKEDKVTLTFTEFVKEADSIESLKVFFRDNREVIDRIEVTKPEEHALIMKAFSNKKKQLQKEKKNG